jgi:hypothetical protein
MMETMRRFCRALRPTHQSTSLLETIVDGLLQTRNSARRRSGFSQTQEFERRIV